MQKKPDIGSVILLNFSPYLAILAATMLISSLLYGHPSIDPPAIYLEATTTEFGLCNNSSIRSGTVSGG
ncbi:MAG: hypothetical protein WAM14_11290 [Candidatus Nitrosopolaris sp.]